MNGGSKADVRLDFEHRVTKLEADAIAIDKALLLQRTETDRRLGELNGEAGRLRAIQQNYTSADSFNALDARVKILEGTQFRLAGQAENRVDNKLQGNFNWTQIVAWVSVAVLLLIELRNRGVI